MLDHLLYILICKNFCEVVHSALFSIMVVIGIPIQGPTVFLSLGPWFDWLIFQNLIILFSFCCVIFLWQNTQKVPLNLKDWIFDLMYASLVFLIKEMRCICIYGLLLIVCCLNYSLDSFALWNITFDLELISKEGPFFFLADIYS